MSSEQDHPQPTRADHTVRLARRPPRLPPSFIFLYAALAAIGVMFVVLVTAYAYTRLGSGTATERYPFPRYFSLSTIVLLASSYVLAQAQRLYRHDDVSGLARCLGATLLLGSVFAGLQLLGWRELTRHAVTFTAEASGTFIYLISALHIIHLLGGMLFVLVLLVRTVHAGRDAIRSLVFIRDPYQVQQLRLLGTYWHFIDALWVGLFAMFLFLY